MLELRHFYRKAGKVEGFTLIELLIVILLVGIMAAFVAPNIKFGINPLKDARNRIASNFRLIRTKAMGQTSAYRISQISATQLKVERAKSCFDTTWTVDPSFTSEDLSLIEAKDIRGLAKNAVIQITTATVNGATVTTLNAFGQPNWQLCYNSRGLADKNVELTFRNIQANEQNRIEVFVGGGVQVYDN